MRNAQHQAFTLIELLVVIAVILILAAISVPIISDMYRAADVVKCANNLKQIGIAIIGEAVKYRHDASGKFKAPMYPQGGITPAEWGSAALLVDSPELLQCPSMRPDAATKPGVGSWATGSYAYVGYLSPVYETGSDPTLHIWRLYWSGVDYDGGYPGDSSAFSKANGYEIADNILWQAGQKDSGEASIPTVPEHLDIEKTGDDDIPKYRTQRALRQIPESPEDDKASLPLVMDICVLRGFPDGASDYRKAHEYITDENKDELLRTNHCNTSARRKKDWGINILYVNQSVQWKHWNEIRFQVMAKDVEGSVDHYYYY